MSDGFWIGLNENDTYTPASLLKLSVAMAYYKQAEADPALLNEQIAPNNLIARAAANISQRIPLTEQLKAGQSYSAAELIRRMLIYSDNQSLLLLSAHLDNTRYLKLYTQLELDPSVAEAGGDTISPLEYANFFRILYNSTYLTVDDSEKILKTLSQASYRDGLASGLPSGVLVADKFGENENLSIEQLHDCGIIYHQRGPYLLCVMTKGTNIQKQQNAIAEISRFFYKAFSAGNI